MKEAPLNITTPPSITARAWLEVSSPIGPGILLLTFSRTPVYITPQACQLLGEINGQGTQHHGDELVLPPDILQLCDTLEARLLQDRCEDEWNQVPVERTIHSGSSTIVLRAFGLPAQNKLHGSQILILLERAAPASSPVVQRASPDYLLTKRQHAIVKGVTRGLTNKELAYELGLSTHTVKEYLRQIMMKLNASSRTAIVSRMAGLLPPSPKTP
jgi:DNA-binding CsgD family transcriptional regulator